ncbi:hypothetical protein KJ865_01975 [Myxococcota bacterium]|nr:hypothetical protein [Myxococcota bacterium]
MTHDKDQLHKDLEELEAKIVETINNISDLDSKMNQPEYTHSDIEIFIMNKKMEQDSLREHMAEKKKLIKALKEPTP